MIGKRNGGKFTTQCANRAPVDPEPAAAFKARFVRLVTHDGQDEISPTTLLQTKTR